MTYEYDEDDEFFDDLGNPNDACPLCWLIHAPAQAQCE